MKHADPYVQELIEQLQGALRMFTDRRIVWRVKEEPRGGWNVRFVIIGARADSYTTAFNISRTRLYDIQQYGARFWESFKWSIIRQCMCNVIDESKAVDESEVEYMAADVGERVEEAVAREAEDL
jgi:hypothetical protein